MLLLQTIRKISPILWHFYLTTYCDDGLKKVSIVTNFERFKSSTWSKKELVKYLAQKKPELKTIFCKPKSFSETAIKELKFIRIFSGLKPPF